MNLNILVVEDHEPLRETIIEVLQRMGHHVRGIDCAEALPEQADLVCLDMAILDLNLPCEDGLSLAARLRETHPDIGLIMLTARVRGEDRAAGYAHGADIYLSKPASMDELEQAVLALKRRLGRFAVQRPTQSDSLHPKQRTLRLVDGRVVALTAHEAALLTAFVRSAQHILETWQIAEILGMDLDHLNKSAIELHMVRLRKKLPTIPGGVSPLQAVRGRGYQLCVPLTVSEGF